MTIVSLPQETSMVIELTVAGAYNEAKTIWWRRRIRGEWNKNLMTGSSLKMKYRTIDTGDDRQKVLEALERISKENWIEEGRRPINKTTPKQAVYYRMPDVYQYIMEHGEFPVRGIDFERATSETYFDDVDKVALETLVKLGFIKAEE
jgi:hypothetical protein